MKSIKRKIMLTTAFLSIMVSALPLPVSASETVSTQQNVTRSNLTLQGERVYQIMTDRFYDGDITNNAKGEALRYQEATADDMAYMKGGDWQGIIEKISYIKEWGIQLFGFLL